MIIGDDKMKQFHYEEVKDLDHSNFLQNAFDLGMGRWLIGVFIIVIASILLLLTVYIFSHFFNKEVFSFNLKAVAVLVAFFGTILFFVMLGAQKEISSIGYYQTQGKVMNIDKQEKVKGKTQYTIYVRYTKGKIEDKKSKPLKVKTKDRYGLKNGDKVIIKTPQLDFKGTENKEVTANDLITFKKKNIFEKLFESNHTQKVPDQVIEKDFKIQKA